MKKENLFKTNEKLLIAIIVLAFLAVAMFFEGIIFKQRKPKDIPLDFILCENENEYCEVYVNGVESFAQKDNEVLYFATDDDYFIYIIEISDKDFRKMEKAYEKDGYLQYNLRGYSKRIPNDVISIAVESFQEIFEMEADREVLEKYVGNYYLDCVNTEYTDKAYIFYLIGGFAALFLFILLIMFFNNKKRVKNVLKNKTKEEIIEQIESEETIYFEKYGIYLTPEYVVATDKTLKNVVLAEKYSDIVLMYFTVHRTYGVAVSQDLNVYLNNFKQTALSGLPVKDKAGDIDKLLNHIYSKNDNILFGYSKENLDRYKEICTELKNKPVTEEKSDLEELKENFDETNENINE